MKAIIKATEDAGSLRVVDMPVPRPGEGEVLVQIKATSICYSDVSVLTNKYVGRKPIPLPMIMGHEGAGVIAEVGAGVAGRSVGERVVVEPIIGCGHCHACQIGSKNLCKGWEHIGLTCHGTFAEYITLPATQVHPIPDHLGFAEAALTEPLGLVVRSLEQSKPMVGETVAIIGPGALGLMHLMAYKAAGASKVIMVGLDQDCDRLKLAKELGADQIINLSQEDGKKAVLDATEGLGADIVVETANSPKATQLTFDLTAPRGRVVLFGLYPEAVFSPVNMLRNAVTVYGDVGAVSGQFVRAINWIASGKVDVGRLITNRFPLHEGPQAFECSKAGKAMKIVFEV